MYPHSPYIHTYTKHRLIDHLNKEGIHLPGSPRQCVFTKDFLLGV